MGTILGLYIWISARLREPSTLASLAAVSATFGMQLDPGTVNDWMTALSLFFGGLGFFVKEKGPVTKV